MRHERTQKKEQAARTEPAANELDADEGRGGSLGGSREFDQEKGRRGGRGTGQGRRARERTDSE